MHHIKKFLILAGTRPEIIKLAPLFFQLKKNKNFKTEFCLTGQHKQLAFMASKVFNLKAKYNLDIMKNNQNLFDLSSLLLKRLNIFFNNKNYDAVIVQGDTTSAFIGSLASFYSKIKVIHIEAGLRTFVKSNPFPEELNRILISKIADYHFSPTKLNKKNLIKEGVNKNNIFIVGNTVIDSLKLIKKKFNIKIRFLRKIVCTIHRHENYGNNLVIICQHLKRISSSLTDWEIIFVIHPNPHIKKTVYKELKNHQNITLMDSLNYVDFIKLLSGASLVISDSGGLQEEVCYLGKYILVARDYTERQELIDSDLGVLIDIKDKFLSRKIINMLKNKIWLSKKKRNCFGNGNSSKIITEHLSKIFVN